MLSEKEKIRRGVLIAIGSAAVFGLWPAAARGLYAHGGNAVFAIISTAWARAIFMLLFCWITKNHLFASRIHMHQALNGGFFQAASNIALFVALIYLPGPVAILIMFSYSLMLLFYTAWRGEGKLDGFTLVSTFMALIGLTLVLDFWDASTSTEFIGYVLAFISAIVTATRVYIFSKQAQQRHPIVVGAEAFLFAALFVSLTAFFDLPKLPHDITGWYYAILGAVSLSMGTFGMFYGMKLLGAFRWSLFLKMEPVFTALFSVLLLGEVLKTSQYLGISIVLGSLIAYQVISHKNAKE